MCKFTSKCNKKLIFDTYSSGYCKLSANHDDAIAGQTNSVALTRNKINLIKSIVIS